MKGKWFKKGVAVSLALLLIGAVGCSTKKDTPDTTKAPSADNIKKFSGQTLKVQFIGDYGMADKTDPVTGQKRLGLHVIKEEFEKKYQGATLEVVPMGWDNYVQKTQAMITANEVDVYQVPGIATLAAQDLLEQLQPYIDKDKFDTSVYIKGQIDGWKAMGSTDSKPQVYSLPLLGDSRLIAYDKKIFDDWKVPYLSEKPSLEEIMDKAKKMTGKNPVTGDENFGISFPGGNVDDIVVNITESFGGQWGTGFKWTEMKTEFNSPEFNKAVQYVKDILPLAPKGLMSNQGNEKWLTAKNNIAINLRASVDVARTADIAGLKDRIGTSYLFVSPKTKTGGMFAGSPMGIGKTSKNKDLAWEFLKFTSTDVVQKFVYENMQSFPVVVSAANWDIFKNNKGLAMGLTSIEMLWTPRYPYRASQPKSILLTGIQNALLGKATVKEALDKTQVDTEAWLKQQK